jgi:cytoskeletal protein RodZ
VESLGEKLKTAREEKNLSIIEISNETNISTKYLEALEREDFSPFPGEPYVLGFIKNYGEYLGLNTEELLPYYRSIKLREQPVPMDQLLKNPSPAPKIIKAAVIFLALLALAGAAYFFIQKLPKKTEPTPLPVRTASEYVLNTDFMERRFYPGDSILVSAYSLPGSAEGNTYKLVFSGVSDAITIATPRGPIMLDLGQEVTIDLNDDGFAEIRILAADFVKNDITSGALLRFEQERPPQIATQTSEGVPAGTVVSAREASTLLFTSPNAFPFTLQAAFQGYCLFRYEILFERDKPGRNEQYYQRTEEVNITAQNGIRLGISNARAVKLQVVGGGRTVPFEAGGAGEVVAADLRWVRDEENRYRLVLLRLE